MENITGNPVTSINYLPTRMYLVEELKSLLRKCSVLVEAPRRFGKTSVIKEFIRQESDKNEGTKEFNIIFLELEGEDSIDDFCNKLFRELIGLYKNRKRLESISTFLGKSWDAIASRLSKIDIYKFCIELREITKDYDFAIWKSKINPIISGLNIFDQNTVIVLDEFPDMLMNFKQKIEDESEFKKEIDGLNAWLRSLRQSQNSDCKFQFVFCGSINLRKTLESYGISKRINDLETLSIPPMDIEEAETLVKSLFGKYKISVDEDGINFILSKIENGPPYYGQIYVKAIRETRKKDFTVNSIKGIYEQMIRGGNHDLKHFHSRINEYFPPIAKEYSDLILKDLCQTPSEEKEIFEKLFSNKCSYDQFLSIVHRLEYEGYITRDINNNGKLDFVSALIKDWWAYKKGVI